MSKQQWRTTFLSLLLLIVMSACGGTPTSTPSGSAGSTSAPATVTIAYQPAMAAVSLVVMKYQKTLEKQFPNTRIEWKLLQSGAAVREAIIANQAQIGFIGIPPFLVGWDRGVNWRVIAGVTRNDCWLVAKDERIKSLKDFTPDDKIAVVAPDSLQAIFLRKAAQEQLGDAHALDKNLVSMPPADSLQALISGQITAIYAFAPFQYQAIEAGAHPVVKSYDVMGKSTTEVIVATQSLYDQYPEFAKAFHQNILEATEFAKTDRDQTAKYLSEDQGNKVAPEQFAKWLAEPTFDLYTTPGGLVDFASFMQSIGLLSKVPASDKDLAFPIASGS